MDDLRRHDLRLFRHLWRHLRKGDIILGDRAFGEYNTLWPGIWFPSDPTVVSHAPSNAAPNLIRYSTNRAVASSKSPTAATTGKADPAIIEALTNRHSGRFLILA